MKVESNIGVGQLVWIKKPFPEKPIYLVVGKHGDNCELVPIKEEKGIPKRRWWNAEGLSVYA